MEVRHVREIPKRNRLATKVVMHAPNYDVVEGFGNSFHIISRDGYKSVQLSSIQNSETIYPELKDPKDRHPSPISKTIYSAPE